jgi:hypothetical protein
MWTLDFPGRAHLGIGDVIRRERPAWLIHLHFT